MSCGKFRFYSKAKVSDSLQHRFDAANKQINLHYKLNKRLSNPKSNLRNAINKAYKDRIISEPQMKKYIVIHEKGNKNKHAH